jgi:hypothetical protein
MCPHKPSSIAIPSPDGKTRNRAATGTKSSTALRSGAPAAMLCHAMTFTGYSPDEDRRPLTYFQGHPIFATTFFVAVHVATMLAVTIAKALGMGGFISLLIFSSGSAIHQLTLWQYFTYAFINYPSIWFAIEMFMLFWFGRDVEQFIGRRAFLRLYLALLLLTPVLLTFVGFFTPTSAMGGANIHFGIFIAFATIYPGALFWCRIPAKVLAFVLVAIYSLQSLLAHDWPGLGTLWATVGFAYGMVRYEQGRFTLPDVFSVFRRKPKFRVVPRPEPRSAPQAELGGDDMDTLLDKIARSGMASLSAKERTQLEKAREELLKKDRR